VNGYIHKDRLTSKNISFIPSRTPFSLSWSVGVIKQAPGYATRSMATFNGDSFSRSSRWVIKGKTSKTPNGTGSPPSSTGTARPLEIESPMKRMLTFSSWKFLGKGSIVPP
jgi:hypothetical protein